VEMGLSLNSFLIILSFEFIISDFKLDLELDLVLDFDLDLDLNLDLEYGLDLDLDLDSFTLENG